MHVMTRISRADAVWVRGIRKTLAYCGGGNLIRTPHGIEVHANRPLKFTLEINWYREFYPNLRVNSETQT